MVDTKCPGLYCGRILEANGSWSECGACPNGFRVNDIGHCIQCTDSPSTYDWLYMGFMTIMPLIMHWTVIDIAIQQKHFTIGQIILHLSAFVEVTLAAVITLLFYSPYGSFKLNSCQVQRLSDWYTLFHNPTPNYETKLYCTQEAVYPLQTMVLFFFLLCIILMMIIRPVLNRRFMKCGKAAVYCALYCFPILALFHTVAAGLIYFAFPYLSVVISMISNAAHFSIRTDQDLKSLVFLSIKESKNFVIIVGHWLLLAYGIIALHQHLALLAMVPLPAIFYIITVKFTNPRNFE